MDSMPDGHRHEPALPGRRVLGAAWRALAGTAAGAARPAAWWAVRTGRPSGAVLAERLALPDAVAGLPRGGIWLHGASVGEVRALVPLARALGARRPDLPLLVTATTRAGRARAAEETTGTARLAPVDARGPLRRFLDAAAPRLHVAVETELWPERLAELARRRIPAALVSARLSPERVASYRRLRGLYVPALESLALLAPASEGDRARFAAIGADPARLGPEGNLKWEAAPPALDAAGCAELAARLGIDRARPWIVLGSVHPGEGLPLVAATEAALGDGPLPGWIVAPRHPERYAAELAELDRRVGGAWRASQGPAPAGCRAVVLDTIGILPRVYALAQGALLGGTFVPVGGHTPLEAAAGGCPLVAGPHVEHQRDLVEPLAASGAIVHAPDVAAAGAVLAGWLRDPAAAGRAGAAARAVVAARSGVAGRLADLLLELAG